MSDPAHGNVDAFRALYRGCVAAKDGVVFVPFSFKTEAGNEDEAAMSMACMLTALREISDVIGSPALVSPCDFSQVREATARTGRDSMGIADGWILRAVNPAEEARCSARGVRSVPIPTVSQLIQQKQLQVSMATNGDEFVRISGSACTSSMYKCTSPQAIASLVYDMFLSGYRAGVIAMACASDKPAPETSEEAEHRDD